MFFLLRLLRLLLKAMREDRGMQIYERHALQKEPKEIQRKKKEYLNIPTIAFHYADKEQIESFFDDYFKEPTVERMVGKMASELSGETSGGFPRILKAKAGGKRLTNFISDIKLPDISLSEKFRRWQREAIKREQVTLGLELVDIDLSDLSAFNAVIDNLSTTFHLTLPEDLVEPTRANLQRKAAENTLVRLEKAQGWVLVEGKFLIKEASDEIYKCIYRHPVNQYLGAEEYEITMSVSLRKDALEQRVAGNYAESIGKYVPLKVYGRVWQPVDRGSATYDLQITPLAVY